MPVAALRLLRGVDQPVVGANSEDAVRRKALDRERPGHADAGIIDVGLVVEVLDSPPWRRSKRRSPAAGRCAPPTIWHARPWQRRATSSSASRGISHSSHVLPSASLSAARSGSSASCHLLPDHVDLGVVGDRFQRDVRHALIDEALADVAVRRRRSRGGARDLRLLHAALRVSRRAGSRDSARP